MSCYKYKDTEGFKCKDYKFYMYSHRCLLLNGRLEPEMSCAFIVKNGNGIGVWSDRKIAI